MSRQGFAALWVLLVLTVMPAAFVLLVDGAAVINAASTGQQALASASAAVSEDSQLNWSATVRADLPLGLAPSAQVDASSGTATLAVPLPIPLGGMKLTEIVVHAPSHL